MSANNYHAVKWIKNDYNGMVIVLYFRSKICGYFSNILWFSICFL